MFSPAPMIQVNALVLKRDERALLYALGKAGVVHLARTEAGPQTAPLEPPDHSSELAQCEDLLRRLENAYTLLDVTDQPPGDEAVALSLDQVDERLQSIESELEELSHRKAQLQQQWGQVTTLLEQISGYQEVDLPLDQLKSFAFLHFAIGSLPAENLEDLRGSAGDNVVLLPLHLITLLAVLYPAYKTLKMRPVDAFRSKLTL